MASLIQYRPCVVMMLRDTVTLLQRCNVLRARVNVVFNLYKGARTRTKKKKKGLTSLGLVVMMSGKYVEVNLNIHTRLCRVKLCCID